MTDNQLLEDIKVLNFQDKQMSLTLLNEALVAMTTDSPFYEENKKLIDEFLVKTITQYGHCENGNNLNEMLFLFWETSREEHFEIILSRAVWTQEMIAKIHDEAEKMYQFFNS